MHVVSQSIYYLFTYLLTCLLTYPGSSGTDNAYSSGDYGLYENFEKLLIEKCAGCLPFGIRVCGLLKSASSNPSESVLRNVMYNTNTQQRNDRLRMLSENIEYVTGMLLHLTHLRTCLLFPCNFSSRNRNTSTYVVFKK